MLPGRLTDNVMPMIALAVACRDVDVRNVRAIIIGPPDTPYEFGFFEVREFCHQIIYSDLSTDADDSLRFDSARVWMGYRSENVQSLMQG